jgi:hypothetical protein
MHTGLVTRRESRWSNGRMLFRLILPISGRRILTYLDIILICAELPKDSNTYTRRLQVHVFAWWKCQDIRAGELLESLEEESRTVGRQGSMSRAQYECPFGDDGRGDGDDGGDDKGDTRGDDGKNHEEYVVMGEGSLTFSVLEGLVWRTRPPVAPELACKCKGRSAPVRVLLVQHLPSTRPTTF